MAVTLDTSVIQTGTGVSTINQSITIAANANRALVVMVLLGDSSVAPAITSVTYGAASLTEVVDTDNGTTFYRAGLFVLANPASGTDTVTLTLAGNAGDLSFVAVSLYDVDQSTPLLTSQITSDAVGFATINPWVGCETAAGGMALGYCLGDETAITPTNSIPEYIAVGTANQSAGATSLAVTGAPAGRLLGDWEYCSIAVESNEAIGVSGTGWAILGSVVQQDATWQQEIYRRRYDGSNADPTFSWTSSVGCSARRWLIRDAGAAAPGFHTTNSGTGTTHTITGENSTANNSAAMYVDHAEANTALGADAGYAEAFDAGSATGPYRLVVGLRDQATSGAGADNFSATGANASWIMRLIELMAQGAQTQQQEVQNFGADVMSANLCTEVSEAGYAQFGWTQASAGFIAIAVGVNPAPAPVAFVPPHAQRSYRKTGMRLAA